MYLFILALYIAAQKLFRSFVKVQTCYECIFYRGKTVYLLYTDDSILAGPEKEEIAQVIKDLKRDNLDVTYQGNMEVFLGINIQRKDEEIHLTQPHLIEKSSKIST